VCLSIEKDISNASNPSDEMVDEKLKLLFDAYVYMHTFLSVAIWTQVQQSRCNCSDVCQRLDMETGRRMDALV